MRIRISFHKTKAMRFTGHLDLHKAWERAIRRARLPLAYSQGFHPQPRINLACALPLGITSACEIADLWLEEEFTLAEIRSRLEKALPPGIQIEAIETVDPRSPSLQTQVLSAEYILTFLNPISDLEERITGLNAAESLPRSRRGKAYDLRPLVESFHRLPDDVDGLPRAHVRLSAREGATGRPEEVASALGISMTAVRYHRMALILTEGPASKSG